jgi:hypothetical protein
MADPIALTLQQAVIPAGSALSAAVGLGAARLHGILIPTPWTAANLTFQVSVDGVNFEEMYDDAGNAITVTAAASRYCALDPTRWRAVASLIVRSGTLGSPVNQVAQATIGLITRPIA